MKYRFPRYVNQILKDRHDFLLDELELETKPTETEDKERLIKEINKIKVLLNQPKKSYLKIGDV